MCLNKHPHCGSSKVHRLRRVTTSKNHRADQGPHFIHCFWITTTISFLNICCPLTKAASCDSIICFKLTSSHLCFTSKGILTETQTETAETTTILLGACLVHFKNTNKSIHGPIKGVCPIELLNISILCFFCKKIKTIRKISNDSFGSNQCFIASKLVACLARTIDIANLTKDPLDQFFLPFINDLIIIGLDSFLKISVDTSSVFKNLVYCLSRTPSNFSNINILFETINHVFSTSIFNTNTAKSWISHHIASMSMNTNLTNTRKAILKVNLISGYIIDWISLNSSSCFPLFILNIRISCFLNDVIKFLLPSLNVNKLASKFFGLIVFWIHAFKFTIDSILLFEKFTHLFLVNLTPFCLNLNIGLSNCFTKFIRNLNGFLNASPQGFFLSGTFP